MADISGETQVNCIMEVNVPSKRGQQDTIKRVYHLLTVFKPFFKIVFRFEKDAVTQIFNIHWWGSANYLFEIQVGVSETHFQQCSE